MRIRPEVSRQCVRGEEGGGGGGATNKMTKTETISMETRSMGMSYSGVRRRGMERHLYWRIIIGRWVGV